MRKKAISEKVTADGAVRLLEQGNQNLAVPGMDWMKVDNVGYRDGWLHIRTVIDPAKKLNNFGYFYLADQNGNELSNAVLNKPFIDGGNEEFILQVEAEKLQDVQLPIRM